MSNTASAFAAYWAGSASASVDNCRRSGVAQSVGTVTDTRFGGVRAIRAQALAATLGCTLAEVAEANARLAAELAELL